MKVGGLQVAVSFAAALVTVTGAELLARNLIEDATADLSGKAARPAHVVPILHAPRDLVDPRPGRTLLLIGNSHTFALPSLEKGKPLRPDPGITLIDRLAYELERRDERDEPINFYRLAYPNFLPFEMLTRVGQMLHAGFRPDVVVIGLTWRNIARDSLPRRQIQRTFDEESFAIAFRDQVARLDPDGEVLGRVDAEIADAARRTEEERTKSDADRIDSWLSDRLGEQATLVGSSRALRMRLYRVLNHAITETLVPARKEGHQYDVVAADLKFNRVCLSVLLRMLADAGAAVVLYQAPERSDYAALIDPTDQERTMAQIREEAAALELEMVDARRAVPNEYWGWIYDEPDRSHFTEKGHALLAELIVRSATTAFARLLGG